MSAPPPVLVAGAVQVWRVALDGGPPERRARDAALLSADERQRAARYRFERDRVRYTAARSALRRLLAPYVGVAPESLAFVAEGAEGKPKLAIPGAPAFNLAHSGGVALLAVAALPRVGVDVEVERAITDIDALASQYFTNAERAAVRAQGELAHRAFLRVWTRKEAVLKAIGCGLTVDLRGVDVGAESGARQVRLGGTTLEVESVELVPGHLVAIALPSPRTLVALSCHDDPPHP